MARGKNLQIDPDAPAPAKRRAPTLSEEPAIGKAAEGKPDWRQSADLRAFACLLSFETGWMSEPQDVAWAYDEARKVVTVMRPPGAATLFGQVEAQPNQNALQALAAIERTWGPRIREKVERYAIPAVAASAPPALGGRARFLLGLARVASAAGGGEQEIEKALVLVVLRAAELAGMANRFDESGSANATRQIARAMILDLIDPKGVDV